MSETQTSNWVKVLSYSYYWRGETSFIIYEVNLKTGEWRYSNQKYDAPETEKYHHSVINVSVILRWIKEDRDSGDTDL